MNSTPKWDDYRLALAIDEAGSLSGAARRLGVNHATVFRRLEALESRLGSRCFERHAGGYTPTPTGETLATTARRMRLATADAERALMRGDTALTGTLRITTTDALLACVLVPALTEFRRAHPGVVIETTTSAALHNLTRREADVALRPTFHPPETLIGREQGRICQSVYVSRTRLSPEGGGGESIPWVAPDASMGYRSLERWMRASGVDRRTGFHADSTLGMASAVEAGLGQGVLPDYLAEGRRGLVRLGGAIDELETPLWLLTHPDIRRSASVSALFEALSARRFALGFKTGAAAATESMQRPADG
ncbi:LysR family transcriptional regulator [Salinicola halophilus]|uniref:LysR family transcriptional regulator n=1 Tax=Salinicola halophilus TaxID=184065 RepID=UPI000DA17F72|nr:LysR family transcriptional regulator [Salinicola halophilus]